MKKKLSAATVVIVVLLLVAWYRSGGVRVIDSAPVAASGRPQPSAQVPSSSARAVPLAPGASGIVSSAPPAAQGTPAVSSSPGPVVPPSAARPVGAPPSFLPPRAVVVPTVWGRLEQAEVLATSIQPQADGSIRRARLVRTASTKYPLVVFEGTLPGKDAQVADDALRDQVAKVASHIIAQPQAGVSASELQQSLAGTGLKVGTSLGPDGPYLVELPEPGLSSVDDAIAALQRSGRAAYAEPDYLVFSSDIPSTELKVEMVNGVPTYPDFALDANTVPPPSVPVFSTTTQAAATEAKLLNYPMGTRILTFDLPTFLGGPGIHPAGIEEQNFIVQASYGNTSISGANSDAIPSNGTYFLSAYVANTVRHNEGQPFRIASVDIAEVSKGVPASTVTFTGYKVDGNTVTQSFTTDGVNDGTGPLADFQTFTFHENFTNLSRVTVNSSGCMIDNIAVLAEGLESPPNPGPVLPLVYEMTWDAPKHQLNQVTALGGYNAPTRINFGTPTVRSQIGTLVGPALEFKGEGYQQIVTSLRLRPLAYRVEFDAYFAQTGEFTILFDNPTVQNVIFRSSGELAVLQPRITGPVGNYPREKLTRITIDIDLVKGEWDIAVDGVVQIHNAYNVSEGDIETVRFSAIEPGAKGVGVDNLRIYAYGANTLPSAPARIAASPTSLVFPAVSPGNTLKWTLSLTNTGSETLSVNTIQSSRSDFRITGALPANVLPGGTYAVGVEFAPTVVGPISGEISITSNDPVRPTFVVPVSGTGATTPRIAVSPANLFVTMLTSTYGTEAFSLTNSGQGSLKWYMMRKGAAAGAPPEDPVRQANDASLGSLWGMRAPQPGQGGIDAAHAWSVVTENQSDIIAVIDSGIDASHPDLQGNIFVNTREIPNNGLDDDGNGYVDDVSGWDFYNDDANAFDDRGHGTHVAGTIAARGNNSLGVAGVCWRARLLPLKFLPATGPGYTSDAVLAVKYATRMGARVSNNSWGGGSYSQALYDAIKAAGTAGNIFVASAGNDSANTDVAPSYPTSYNLDNIVSVASTDSGDQLSYFSNYGVTTVDLAGPGSDVLSLKPGGQYAYLSGTSMAAPHVAGTIGLILGQSISLKSDQTRELLKFGTDSLASLSNKTLSGGRVNAYRSLKSVLPGWIDPNFASGEISAGKIATVPLSISTSGLAVGTYSQVVVVKSNDPERPAVEMPIELSVIAHNGYRQWRALSFSNNKMLTRGTESTLWGDSSDPDGDGLGNLVEYLIGTDPEMPGSGAAPKVVAAGDETVYEFQVRTDLSGLNYRVEWNTTLAPAGWTTAGLSVVENTTEGVPAGLRRVRVKVAGAPPSRAFFRLVVSANP